MDLAESKLAPGYRLDRYELICPIASGGMAMVWLARLRGKRGFEKLFAIKTIKTEHISDASFQEMFLDEARIASRIIHPNVAQIVELGEQDEILYLVMEFVDGDSLAKLNRLGQKRGKRLPAGVALKIMADVCDGLHAAHQLVDERGESLAVVHRDVSPQNILVTTAGIAKVIDFGLVKAKNRSSAETQSGVVKGKIRYMAPEQLGGTRIDHRADVWAVGMCLYELLSGIIPYANDDDLEVLRRLTSSNPLPPFDLGLEPQLNTLLAHAIVREPEGRFASCAAMRKAIDATAKELGLDAGTDDVAEYLRHNLPELASRRAETIAHAIATADALPGSMSGQRVARVGQLATLDAFAATEVGRPAGPTSSETRSYGQTPSTTSLREQLGERQRGGHMLLVGGLVAAAGLGAWLLWPRHEPAAALADVPVPAATTAAPAPEPATSVIELGSTPTATAAARPASPRPAAAPSTTARASAAPSASAAPPSDGGLSAAAQSAAAIMLAPPKPTESAAPAPAPSAAPATSDTPK